MTKIQDALIQMLGHEMLEQLEPLGFANYGSPLYYHREPHDPGKGQSVLGFPTHESRTSRRVIRVAMNVGVRFLEIERLTRLDDPTYLLGWTVWEPIGSLMNPPRYVKWDVSDTDTCREAAREARAYVNDYAIPFWSKLPTIEALESRLLSETPRDWAGCDPLRRFSLLAAIRFNRGDRDGALSMLRDKIAKQPVFPPKYRLRLQRLLDHLEQVPE